jgi:hypothetical protein
MPKINEEEDFVVLQAGQYWRALEAMEDREIRKGDVLLIQSVRDVDKAAHTIILRPHPRWYAAHPRSEGEDRFLVDDFLAKFEPCPDYKRIRNAELAEVQGRVTELQKELAEISTSNPDSMKEHVEEGLRAWEKKQKLLPGTASTLPPPTADTVIDGSLTTEKIETMKLSMGKAHEVAVLQAGYIKEKVDEIGETVRAMTPFYQEQAAAALATTEDVQAHVKTLLTGIASLDLYVGTDVHVEEVKKGKDAPGDLPLTIMQRKLYVDEELSAWAHVDAKFDYNSDKQFFKALEEHPSFVKQIFPTARCIVCMAITQRERDYGNAWENATKNEQNKTVFLLVRNGENIRVVYSPVESHMKSPRLFPSKKDVDDIFRETKWMGEDEGRQITYNDVQYTDKLSEHEKLAVHYKRFLILLAGLDHRMNLFGSFYEGPKDMKFISMKFQQEHMSFVYDDMGSDNMLPLEDKPGFSDWVDSKNAYLQSGSRAICKWDDVMNSDTAPGVIKPSYSGRDRRLADPVEKYGVKVAYREGKDIFVKCRAKRNSWNSSAEFDASVNLSKFKHYKTGFICLDAVKADELEWYVFDRKNRARFFDYIRVFKTAIKYLRQEEKQEAPTRAKLAKALQDGKVASAEDAARAIDTAVIAWRAAHRGAALAGAADPVEFPKLLNQIWTVLRNMDAPDAEWKLAEKWAESEGLEPLRFVQSGKAQTVALYCAPKPAEEDNRLWPMAWVHRIVLSRKDGGFKEQSRQWKRLLSANATETTLHTWAGAAAWTDRPSPMDRHSDKQECFGHIEGFEANSTLLHPMEPVIWDTMFAAWFWLRKEMLNKVVGKVSNPSCVVPFGLVLRESKLYYLAVGMYDAAYLLYRNAPDKERKEKLAKEYSQPYRLHTGAHDRITGKDKDYNYRNHLNLFEFPVSNEPQPNGLCDFSPNNVEEQDIELHKLTAHVKKMVKKVKKYHENAKFWLDGPVKNINTEPETETETASA